MQHRIVPREEWLAEAGEVSYTYSVLGRNAKEPLGTCIVHDLMPKGRHDDDGFVDQMGRWDAAKEPDECCGHRRA